MSFNIKKRFFEEVHVTPAPGGFGIHLDARPLKTPAKADFAVPTRALAEEVAAEWRALGREIDPEALPFTKLSNSAIDSMQQKTPEVIETLAAYAQTDLLCYRADAPRGLVQQQADIWDPILDWLRDTHQILLIQTVGIVPVPQPEGTSDHFSRWLTGKSPFELMAAHDLIMLSGSIVLGRAVMEGHLSAEAAWHASIVDEMWQVAQWGEDEEAAKARAAKAKAFETAARFYQMSGASATS